MSAATTPSTVTVGRNQLVRCGLSSAAVVFLLSLGPIVFGAGAIPGMPAVGLVLLGVMHWAVSVGIVVRDRARGLPA